MQGQWPKRRLIERFREGAREGRPGCVLVASASFWEGVDVPGDALQLVIIDKLPFPPPGDPLVEARAQRLEVAGPQRLQRLLRARSRGGAEAGRRPPDPPRDRTRACWWCATRGWRRWATAGGCWPRCRRCARLASREQEFAAKRWRRALRSRLPELPPRILLGLEPARQVVAVRVVLLQHAAGVVAQLRSCPARRRSAPG